MEKGKHIIMVADDDVSFLEEAAAVLTGAGFKVVAVNDGREALQSAISRKVDLIFLDVSMPHLSGVETCHCLKAMPNTSKVPVILTASKKDPEAKRIAEHMQGSKKILRKPFEPGELVAEANRLLRPRAAV